MSEVNRPLEYNDSFPVGWVPQPKVITAEEIRAMSPARQRRMAEIFKQYKETEAINPLWHVYMRSQAHHAYASCRALIGICLAGNRFGKTSTAVLLALINCVPMEWVPPHLMQYRRYLDDEPFVCRITGTSLKDHALDIVVPLLKRWTPRATLKGGAWDKAWSAANYTLTFKHGSSIEFRSYDQPAENHAGAARHAIFLDEPPPRDIFFESLARVTEFDGGFVRVGATMAKGVPSWFRKELYEKSKTSPDIEVFFGSIHDNDTISADNKEKVLSIYSERERKIREYGRLLSLEGAIYDAFDFTKHVVDDVTPAQIRDYKGSVYVGIDPGLRAPGAVFAAANNLTEEVMFFDEVTPQQSTMSVEIFVGLIRERMEYWGLRDEDVHFIIDPAVLQGMQNTGETLRTEFERHGLYAELGNNSHEVGIPRFNDLLRADKAYFNGSRCFTTIDQMETWSWHETLEDAKGRPKPEEGNDCATDCCRYIVVALPWSETVVKKDPAPAKGTLEEFLQNIPKPLSRARKQAAWAL